MTRLRARLRSIPSWQVTLGAALLALGFLVAAQLSAERPRVRYTTQERPPLVETVGELQRNQDALKARILELRAAQEAIAEGREGSEALVGELNRQLEEARIAAGLTPLSGPGVVLRLEDAEPTSPDEVGGDSRVTGRDIRGLVEELWLAGAEAISVNGERLTAASAIVEVGESVLLNQAWLAPPYEISSIGPPELFERLSASQGFQDFVAARVEGQGIRAAYGEFEQVEVPAFAGTFRLAHARVQPTPGP